MGREANITPDQVHAIADAIRAEGGSCASTSRVSTGAGTVLTTVSNPGASAGRLSRLKSR